jgi:hypothetical protein
MIAIFRPFGSDAAENALQAASVPKAAFTGG